MAYKAMWNFGSVRIESPLLTGPLVFNLEDGRGVMEFEEFEQASFTSDTGRLIKKSDRNRAYITIDLVNVKDGTSDLLSELVNLLNISQGYNGTYDEPIRIYPRFNSDFSVDENYYVECYRNSNVAFKDIATMNVGQRIRLEFISVDLIPIPTTSVPVFQNWQVNDNGVISTLQFNDNGSIVDAKFNIG